MEPAAFDNLDRIRSAVSGVVWPGLPAGPGAMALAMQFQLDESQWWPPEEVERRQMRQLQLLLRHAHDTVPFWRARLSAAGYAPGVMPTREWLSTLPLLARGEIQEQGAALFSAGVPPQHGQVTEGHTSGSTGSPIRYRETALSRLFWRVFTLRDHLWHRRDFSAGLAAIRAGVDERTAQGWGLATDESFVTGTLSTFPISTAIDTQLTWLQRYNPAYLLTYASNLKALARRALELDVRLPGLKEVRTVAEAVDPDLRALCQQAWG
ncbi:MAG: hypothetical protein KIT18_16055, partial [Burkholderiales bacterium]|nr:hypothetical protein [Burkholderiales bacterium]